MLTVLVTKATTFCVAVIVEVDVEPVATQEHNSVTRLSAIPSRPGQGFELALSLDGESSLTQLTTEVELSFSVRSRARPLWGGRQNCIIMSLCSGCGDCNRSYDSCEDRTIITFSRSFEFLLRNDSKPLTR